MYPRLFTYVSWQPHPIFPNICVNITAVGVILCSLAEIENCSVNSRADELIIAYNINIILITQTEILLDAHTSLERG